MLHFFKPKLILPLIFFSLLIFKTITDSKAVVHSQRMALISKSDSVVLTQKVTDFLRWYRQNIHKAASFPLLAESRDGYLVVDKVACKDYLNFLEGSHFVSNKYIGSWEQYFDDQSEKLKKDKLTTDVPDGFDFDFVLYTQEPEIVLENLEKLKFEVTNVEKDIALVSMELPFESNYQFTILMQQTRDGWQIANIKRHNFN